MYENAPKNAKDCFDPFVLIPLHFVVDLVLWCLLADNIVLDLIHKS